MQGKRGDRCVCVWQSQRGRCEGAGEGELRSVTAAEEAGTREGVEGGRPNISRPHEATYAQRHVNGKHRAETLGRSAVLLGCSLSAWRDGAVCAEERESQGCPDLGRGQDGETGFADV